MVTVRLSELDIDVDVTHISTDYQVATDRLFSIDSIVCESIDDTVNKTFITFNEVLDPTIKYYGRARVRLSTGCAIWGDVSMFIPKDINDVELDGDLPTRVGIPQIASSSSFEAHTTTLFTLYATGFGVIGNAGHTMTSWIIEDVNGNIVWSSVNDYLNKTKISINSILLKENNIYRFKVIFHTTSNDASQIATKTVRTYKSEFINLQNNITHIDGSVDNEISIFQQTDLTSVNWKIFTMGENKEQLTWEYSSNTNVANIPANTLKNVNSYLLAITTNLSVNPRYIAFTTY